MSTCYDWWGMNFDQLKKYTQARIGLGHCGASLPTKAWLDFAYHHACAMDAIAIPWKIDETIEEVAELRCKSQILSTPITNRQEYLLRPDLGKLLDENSRRIVEEFNDPQDDGVMILVSNGLSTLSIKNHAAHLLKKLVTFSQAEKINIYGNCLFFVENGRVGLIDDIGELLNARLGIIIIGERPGLSAQDSLAIYLTYQPRRGRTNAERNCISNIRPPSGLSYDQAVQRTIYLMKESMRRKLSGVALKEISSSNFITS